MEYDRPISNPCLKSFLLFVTVIIEITNAVRVVPKDAPISMYTAVGIEINPFPVKAVAIELIAPEDCTIVVANHPIESAFRGERPCDKSSFIEGANMIVVFLINSIEKINR